MKQIIAYRIKEFLALTGLEHPILLAPMAGACPPELSATVANAGGLGACGALLLQPEQILQWSDQFRSRSNGKFQINLWVPEPEPERNPAHEQKVAAALSQWGPEVNPAAGDAKLIDFNQQLDAILAAKPLAFSTIMGIPDEPTIKKIKANGLLWFATVTTVAEGLVAQAAGADILVAQGAEAGGHRGVFNNNQAVSHAIGTFSLVPALSSQTDLPIIATGGIADAQTATAALMLGASAVQIGTGFLRCPEAGLNPAWAKAISQSPPEETTLTRGFSGRTGRAIRSNYVKALETGDLPEPAPYPVQRGLTAQMRTEAAKQNDIDRIQAWAGQSAMLSKDISAQAIAEEIGGEIRAFFN